MKAYITAWLLLTARSTGLARPVGLVAMEDPQFEAQFVQRTIPQLTGKRLHISPQQIRETTITHLAVSGQQTESH